MKTKTTMKTMLTLLALGASAFIVNAQDSRRPAPVAADPVPEAGRGIVRLRCRCHGAGRRITTA